MTLAETKTYLRVDGSDDDALIDTLIAAAEEYLFNATGSSFVSTNYLARLAVLIMIADWYEHREATGQVRPEIRPAFQGIMTQLQNPAGSE